MTQIPGIFDQTSRNNQDYKDSTETHFGYLNRTGRGKAQIIRTVIEQWFKIYCDNVIDVEQIKKLRGNLRSKDDDQFLSAFFELYIYILFKNMGFDLKVEPPLQGTANRLDFFVKDQSENEFHLEAKCVFTASVKAKAEKEIAKAVDRIHKTIESSLFTFDLSYRGRPKAEDVNKKILGALQTWVNQLEENYQHEVFPTGHTFQFDDWDLTVEIMPRPSAKIKKSTKNVSTWRHKHLNENGEDLRSNKEAQEEMLDDFSLNFLMERIYNSMHDKATKYGQLDKPFVIALNMVDDYFKLHMLEDALFGADCVVDYGNGIHIDSRLNNGFWTKPGYEHKLVSGMLAAFNLTPWTMFESQRTSLIFVNHPSPHYVLPNVIPITKGVYNNQNATLELIGGPSLINTLNLPLDEYERSD